MSVLLQTSKGDIVVDVYAEETPIAAKNFLKLCKCARAMHSLWAERDSLHAEWLPR